MKINDRNHSFLQKQKNMGQKKSSLTEGEEPRDTLSLNNTGSPSGNYILTPKNSLMRSSVFTEKDMKSYERKLKKHNIAVEDKIPLVGAFSAKLSPEEKKEAEKAGFNVYEDKQERWIPEPEIKDMEKPMYTPDGTGEVRKEHPGIFGTDSPLFQKYTGKGVGIAVIDTGIYPHPDIADRIVGWADMVNDEAVPYDDGGHGTHVAGSAAGSGKLSGGKYRSFAPDADLIGIKVLAGNGGGTTAALLKGIEWAIEHKDEFNIKVMNVSIGHKAEDYSTDPTDIALKKAVDAGITVLAAAGNYGPNAGSVSAPGDSPFVITVGGVDDMATPEKDDDTVLSFSSRGPTPLGLTKPDIVAPGEQIISTLSPMSNAKKDAEAAREKLSRYKWLDTLSDEQLMDIPDKVLSEDYGMLDSTVEKFKSSPEEARKYIKSTIYFKSRTPLLLKNAYLGLSGTSMATPIVAGVVAAMYEANPDLQPMDVKNILMDTADKMNGPDDNSQGAGFYDPQEAVLKAESMKMSNE